MNKDNFFKITDEELTKRIKELPILENLSTMYSKHAYILMIYACFEGFIYIVSLNFFELLKNERKRGIFLNAHYDFCVDLYCNDSSKVKNIWRKFSRIKNKIFNSNNTKLIDTNDNLGYEIFRYILFLLNISEYQQISSSLYSKTLNELKDNQERNYIYYKDTINELLTKRNDIAHGNSRIFNKDFLTKEKIKNYSKGIITVLKQFKNDIEDIVENDVYKLKI